MTYTLIQEQLQDSLKGYISGPITEEQIQRITDEVALLMSNNKTDYNYSGDYNETTNSLTVTVTEKL